MSGEWKPGDVAVRTSINGDETRTVVAAKCFDSLHEQGPHWHHLDGGWDPIQFKFNGRGPTYRPLVVIDPEDREQVERLSALIDNQPINVEDVEATQAALREFAYATPPMPPEPTGLGAIVERQDGRRWVRREDGQWTNLDAEGMYLNWSSWSQVSEGSPVVRVLSEGVQS